MGEMFWRFVDLSNGAEWVLQSEMRGGAVW